VSTKHRTAHPRKGPSGDGLVYIGLKGGPHLNPGPSGAFILAAAVIARMTCRPDTMEMLPLSARYEVPEFAKQRPRTRIVCTIGPATATVAKIAELVQAGMSVARLNLAHGTAEVQAGYLRAVREAAHELNVTVGVLADLPGPKYRTGRVTRPGTMLKQGAQFVLTASQVEGDSSHVSVAPPGLHRDVKQGARILIDDGAIEMHVDRVQGEDVYCTVTGEGELKQRKGVAAPGHTSTLDYFTDETKQALDFVAIRDVDFVGLSYIRTAEDLRRVRTYLGTNGRVPQLISKIELGQAVENLQDIIGESDGVMVARGDLGVEMPLEIVPQVQKQIIRAANDAGKVVITATQMLESMVHAPNPTRAEASDVHNAVLDGTDAIMLSAETSVGQYTTRAVEYMARIAKQAEQELDHESLRQRHYSATLIGGQVTVDDVIAHSACRAATALGAKVILAFTESGSTAARVAVYRPSAPIVALTQQPAAGTRLSLRWGVLPVNTSRFATVQQMFHEGSVAAVQMGYAKHGDLIVAVVGMPIGVPGNTNLLRVIRVPEPPAP